MLKFENVNKKCWQINRGIYVVGGILKDRGRCFFTMNNSATVDLQELRKIASFIEKREGKKK